MIISRNSEVDVSYKRVAATAQQIFGSKSDIFETNNPANIKSPHGGSNSSNFSFVDKLKRSMEKFNSNQMNS